ncbi:MAG: hypothetical protein EXR95_06725 [Gemmatimonadetes bacterium]|nr:hypothetical protein [Gemmatimonadota bacterium]
MSAPTGVPAAVARVRAHLARRAFATAGLLGAVAAVAVLALAWWIAGPAGWAQGTATPLLLDAALVSIAAALWLWVRAARRGLADARLARAMETSAGLDAGAVEGALQLARAVPNGVSRSLAVLAERGVAARLDRPDRELSGPLGETAGRWTRRAVTLLALTAPVLVLLLAAAPARSMSAWSGLGRPLRLLARANLPPLEVSPGDAEVPRGAPFAVTVRAPGRTQVTIRWHAAGDVSRSQTITAEGDSARFEFAAVNGAIEYSAAALDGASSATYRLTPVDPLLVSDVTVELSFPAHTGRAPEEYRGETPPLVVPEGTRFRFEGQATRTLAFAGLEGADGSAVALAVAGSGFAGGWIPRGGGTWAWRFRDRDGSEAELTPAPIELTLVPDSAPSIRFVYPGNDTTLPMSRRQPLVLEVRDDYGLTAMELVAYRVTSLGERRAPVVKRTDLGGTRGALARPMLDVSGWGLLPGDTVRYYARAVDNAPGAGTAQTPEYALRMPGAAELRRGAQRELETMAGRLQELADRAQRAGDQARDLERSASSRGRQTAENRSNAQAGRRGDADRAGFENRERLRRAIEEQQAMSEEARRARADIEAVADALREAGASDPQLQKDLAELQELLEEEASPELRERLAALSDRVDNVDPRQVRQTLDELARQQERFREQLEQSLEQLRRAAAAQDFRATTEDARELAQREEALADAMREGDRPELRAQQQAALQQDAAELGSRLAQLEQRLEGLEEQEARSGVQEAQREAGEARSAMERAQQSMRPQAARPNTGHAGQPRPSPEAAQQAEQAAAALERAADQLEQARQEMSTERAQQLAQALAQAADDALTLARGQAQVRQDMRNAGRDGMAELIGDEAAIQQGLKNLAGSLEQAGGESSEMRSMDEQMQGATAAVEQTLRAMQGQRGTVGTPQSSAEGAVQALNRLALSVLAAGQQMAESSSGGDVMQQLEQLAQQQGQLNNRAGQISPMQLGQQAMGDQLEQLSGDQSQIADNLEGLSEQPPAEWQALGDLQALAQEAQQLADRLAGGRLDAETRERQERLFHHLLDAGRTLERDEVSEQRESTTASDYEDALVQPLGADALGVLRYSLPSAAELMRLTPAERELVLRYFDRLNRAPAAAPAGGR